MKIQIENLRAQMRGVQLNNYQRALALDEYYKLLDYVEELEQLTIHDVVGQSEQLKAISDLQDFAFEVCPLHREDDLHDILSRL